MENLTLKDYTGEFVVEMLEDLNDLGSNVGDQKLFVNRASELEWYLEDLLLTLRSEMHSVRCELDRSQR